jgi:hypothetical protein
MKERENLKKPSNKIETLILSMILILTSVEALTIMPAANAQPPTGPYISIEPDFLEYGPAPSIGQEFNVTIWAHNFDQWPVGMRGIEVHVLIDMEPGYLEDVAFTNLLGQTGGFFEGRPTDILYAIQPGWYGTRGVDRTYKFAAAVSKEEWNAIPHAKIAELKLKIVKQPEESLGEPDIEVPIALSYTEAYDDNVILVPHDLWKDYGAWKGSKVLLHPKPAGALPNLEVQPAYIEANYVNQLLDVNVAISGLEAVWDMGGFILNLTFSPTALEAQQVSAGEFLARFGDIIVDGSEINNTLGYVWINVTYTSRTEAPYGDGILATIRFKALSKPPSSSILKISPDPYTMLYVWQQPTKPIYFNPPVNGFYQMMEIIDHTVTWANQNFIVRTMSNSSVSQEVTFDNETKSITFYVTGPDGTKGFCNVTIPKSLLKADNLTHGAAGAWTVRIVNIDLTYQARQNATHTALWFTYTHSTKRIRITGTEIGTPPTPPEEGGVTFDWTQIAIIAVAAIAIIAVVAVIWLKKKPKPSSEKTLQTKE